MVKEENNPQLNPFASPTAYILLRLVSDINFMSKMLILFYSSLCRANEVLTNIFFPRVVISFLDAQVPVAET